MEKKLKSMEIFSHGMEIFSHGMEIFSHGIYFALCPKRLQPQAGSEPYAAPPLHLPATPTRHQRPQAVFRPPASTP